MKVYHSTLENLWRQGKTDEALSWIGTGSEAAQSSSTAAVKVNENVDLLAWRVVLLREQLVKR